MWLTLCRNAYSDRLAELNFVPCLFDNMAVIADSGYGVLRGCLENFLGPDFKSNATVKSSPAPNSVADCTYGPTERKVDIPSGTKTVRDIGYNAVQFCDADQNNGQVTKPCNIFIKLSDLYGTYTTDGETVADYFKSINCPLAQSSSKLSYLTTSQF